MFPDAGREVNRRDRGAMRHALPMPSLRTPAGLERFVPRFHWELLVCGLRGHLVAGRDVAQLTPDDAAVAREVDGVRWHRCLRCDSWTPLPPPTSPAREHMPPRDQIELPRRGRALRDAIVLRVIAVDRAVHCVALLGLALAVLLFANDQAHLRNLYTELIKAVEGVGQNGAVKPHQGLLHELDRVFAARRSTLRLIALGLAGYGILEGVEAVGLWLMKRWAEYLTLIATALFIPYELHELAASFSLLKITAFAFNLAVVCYLLYAKRLFGIRGGGAEEERIRHADSGWEAVERTAPPVGGFPA